MGQFARRLYPGHRAHWSDGRGSGNQHRTGTPNLAQYVENEYFQALEETGAVGLALVLAFAAVIWANYARAARALGVGNGRIMWKHILPNSMTPVVTFLPFRMSAAILALTSLDFLGLGVPPGTPSLGELLSQGKNNIDAWWISLSTFAVLVITLLLLTFMGDALRDALDPRKADK